MFAFNHHFHFVNENETFYHAKETIKPTIYVVEKSHTTLSNIFSIRSPWVSMTLRNVRYYSNVRFETVQRVESWALEIEDVVTLIWSKEGEIHYIRGSQYTAELLAFWVLHTFFPLVLALRRDAHVLHVGAVMLEEKAILFSALSFGGKSTLTHYFLHKNHAFLGDDTLAIKKDNHSYNAMASYPYIRPYRTPETLGERVQNVVTKPIPIQAMYHLEQADKDAQISIKELHGIEKFKALKQSGFVTFDFLKKEHMAFFVQMAEHIPIYRIGIPWNIERLDEVYQAILTHNRV